LSKNTVEATSRCDPGLHDGVLIQIQLLVLFGRPSAAAPTAGAYICHCVKLHTCHGDGISAGFQLPQVMLLLQILMLALTITLVPP
jgi:hypothetical protein